MSDAIHWLGEENCAQVFAFIGWDHPDDELDHSRIFGLGPAGDLAAKPGDWIVRTCGSLWPLAPTGYERWREQYGVHPAA